MSLALNLLVLVASYQIIVNYLMIHEGPCFHNSLKAIFVSSVIFLLISMNWENKSFFGSRVAEDEGTLLTVEGKTPC